MTWEQAVEALFRAPHGIWELPVSTFEERGGGMRHLQVTAVSWLETVDYLWKARALGLQPVRHEHVGHEAHHQDDAGIEQRPGGPHHAHVHEFAPRQAEPERRGSAPCCRKARQRMMALWPQ